MKRMLVLVLLLASTTCWSQARAADNDGRNWIMWSRQEKAAIAMGMVMMEAAFFDFIEAGWNLGEVSDLFGKATASLGGQPGTIGDLVDAIDFYYSDMANRTIVIWKAFYISRGIAIWTGD